MDKHALLLVDDDPNILNALRRSLSGEGYDIYAAPSGEEALELLKLQKIDVVVSDQIMPGITGVELLKRVRLRYPDMARIMLTGNANLQMAAQAINYGEIARMLLKPWDDTELKLSIQLSIEEARQRKQERQILAQAQEAGDKRIALERKHPGIWNLKRGTDGSILLE